ncbi:MAG: hypothetical protein DYG98_06195 [Haliscomenobacteraceae bacterium CHB4]|nr:hypothetical protein [Saprospiraceae bacterium]MCE7922626.1 hypothetical protein [Haliscomenobacteraceae bacterium CHB4]
MANVLLEKIRSGDFSDFSGASLSMKIPLTREFLNRNLEKLTISNVKQIKIDSITGSTVLIQIKTALLVSLSITVEVQEELEKGTFGLRMKITDGLGRIGRSVIDSLLPYGMRITDDVVYINLRHFLLKGLENQALIDKITRAVLTGGDDRLYLELDLKI